MKSKLTEEDIIKAHQLYLDGLSFYKIGKIFNIDKSSIKYHLLKRELIFVHNPWKSSKTKKTFDPIPQNVLDKFQFTENTTITKEKRKKIVVELYYLQFNEYQIGEVFQIGYSRIREILAEANVIFRKRMPINKILKTPNERKYILDFFEIGKTVDEISEITGISRSSVLAYLKEEGAEISLSSSHRIYPINENFFEKIDTEEKAYFLGLLYVDGNVFHKTIKSYTVSIGLIEKDKYLLEILKSLIQPERPLFKNKMKSINHQQSYNISFISFKLGEDLIKLGCVPNKSLILRFPNFEQVPEDLIHHFIRGYFDGDGTFRLNKSKKSGGIKIISSNIFCDQFKNFLYSIKINCKHYKITNNTGSIQIMQKDSIRIFFNFIYADCSIKMLRKFEKLEILMKNNLFNANVKQ